MALSLGWKHKKEGWKGWTMVVERVGLRAANVGEKVERVALRKIVTKIVEEKFKEET